MNRGEILSPAGSIESVISAVRCGTDAVYLGVNFFNARINAKNFSFDELQQAIRYCHEHCVKVYLTLNTLVSDDEMQQAVEVAKKAAMIGIDAIIVQDLGLAENIRRVVPDVELHASTQMSVQTEYGINFLGERGFTRAVLPRELSKEEILELLEKSNIELEMFVHGALCMCVSGQCYMSAMIGQRSGNRGLCAQPCRLPFSANDKFRYDLSLKDNSLIKHIKELSDAGIASFKIEGRMKRPEYVAAAVTSCKNALENKHDSEIDKNLKDVFSRSGFTDGYYTSRTGKEMFGVRSKSDVENSANVLKKLQKLYEKEKVVFEISFDIVLRKNEKIILRTKCNGFQNEIISEETVQEGKNKFLSEEEIKQQFEKLGGTQFYLGEFSCEADENIFVSMSVLNNLRRQAVKNILESFCERKKPEAFQNAMPDYEKHFAKAQKTYYVFSDAEQIPESVENEELFLPIFSSDNNFTKFEKVGAIMPRGISGCYKTVYDRMRKLKQIGIKKVICPTIDTLEIARKISFEIVMGFTSNIYNTDTLEFFSKNGASEGVASVELTAKKIQNIGGNVPRGVVAYGKIPLMLTKNCPIKNVKNCNECKQKSKLRDRKGIEFEVVCSNGYSEILNKFPICIFDKKDDFYNSDFFMLYFTTESKDEVENIVSNYHRNTLVDQQNFTRGLYYRKS